MGRADEDPVLATITAHAASMLRVARQHSLCHDDAQDAYQRALELYLRRVDEVRPATAGEWLRTVSRNEAIRLRERRARTVGADAVALEDRADPDAREPGERAAALERVAHAAEALQRCKPDESRAILLQAGGASYREIGEHTGWSPRKVDRALTEGRRAFLHRFAAIESGEACAEHAATLAAIADGEATPEDYLAVRPHLRHCVGCRATLKALYAARPALGALVPPAFANGSTRRPAASAARPPVGPAAGPTTRPAARSAGLAGPEAAERFGRAREAAPRAVAVAAAVVLVATGAAMTLGGAPPALPAANPVVARSAAPVSATATATPHPTGRSRGRAAAASSSRLLPPGKRRSKPADTPSRSRPRATAAPRRPRPRATATPARTAAPSRTAVPAPTATPAPARTAAATAAPARRAPSTDSAGTEFGFEG